MDRASAETALHSNQLIGEGWFMRVNLDIQQGAHTALGMSRREYAEASGRAKLIDPTEAIKELAKTGASNQAISEILGIRKATVVEVLAPVIETVSELEPVPPEHPEPEISDSSAELELEPVPPEHPEPDESEFEIPDPFSEADLLSKMGRVLFTTKWVLSQSKYIEDDKETMLKYLESEIKLCEMIRSTLTGGIVSEIEGWLETYEE